MLSFPQKKLINWFQKHKRVLPWRIQRTPYGIWISEIMLQQTQASRVEEKLPVFLTKFPSFQSLACASKAEVIRAWQGMGYNNRALRLKELAIKVVEEYGSQLPCEPETLLQLPGIGKYTAHAVTCFAFRKRVPVVDVNIQRVLSRVFSKMALHSEMQPLNEIWDLAGKILPRDTYSWNQALMELGSTLCKARSTQCGACPLQKLCQSRQLGSAQSKIQKTEPSLNREKQYDGIPLRLWRGKIVEVLRSVHGDGSVTITELGKRIKNGFHTTERLWLQSLVSKLEKDGMVQTKKRGQVTRVMLAE